MPKFSVKKPLTILVATLAVVVLGVVAYLKMTPDLMPNMDFPYVILITSDPGASPEAIEQSVTRPLEQSWPRSTRSNPSPHRVRTASRWWCSSLRTA